MRISDWSSDVCSSELNGNPCTGNSGNSGQQGNAYRQAPTAIIIPVEPVDGRGAYITQIGDSNNAVIRQAAARGHANIHQEGDHNAAEVTQDGNGVGYVDARQTGDLNVANIPKGGVGHKCVYLTQNGINNHATSVDRKSTRLNSSH